MSPLEAYYARLPDGHRELLLAADRYLRSLDDLTLEPGYKWRTPTYDYRGRHIAYLYHEAQRGLSYVAFAAGKHLRHPLLRGEDRKIMRYLPLDPDVDLPVDAIADCLRQAAAHIDEHGSGWQRGG